MISLLTNILIPQRLEPDACTVDLEKDFQHYSFLKNRPEECENISQLFEKTIRDSSGNSVSLSSLLQKSYCVREDLTLLEDLGFDQLSSNPVAGITLEHPDFPGWLIKKNYGFYNKDGKLVRINKSVTGSDFPFWMLPENLRNVKDGICFPMPNDIIHPLRVPMLEKGRKCINQLKLTHIEAVKEYLYELPNVSAEKALHERVVVISQKADILSDVDNLRRFATMADKNPDRLARIVNELVVLIRNWKLTDTHLGNFRFLKDGTDKLIAIDGEPIGTLADANYPEMVKIVRSFDPNIYAILGLKKLQSSIEVHMEEARIDYFLIEKVQKIFDEKINAKVSEITRESVWNIITKHIRQTHPGINMTCAFYNTLRNQISYYRQQPVTT